ncbi:hypothetical protein Emed_004790 [Eimeria media]
MAFAALKEDVVRRLRACAAADGAYFMACMHLLRTEQERRIDFAEASHMHMSTELLESSRRQSPQTNSSLTVSQMLARMSLLFKGVEHAAQTFVDARIHHALVFRQYLLLELAIKEVSLDPLPVSPSGGADMTPQAAEAAADAAADEAVECLTRLQSIVCDKEIDQHLHDRLRWQQLLQPQTPPMLPRLLFIPLEQQQLLEPQLQRMHRHRQQQQQQQQQQAYAQGFQQLPFQNGGRLGTVESVMI